MWRPYPFEAFLMPFAARGLVKGAAIGGGLGTVGSSITIPPLPKHGWHSTQVGHLLSRLSIDCLTPD